jgi:phosphatidylserine/phosphatidylglycerophosphate/cardiolipin synthase-like enzyme
VIVLALAPAAQAGRVVPVTVGSTPAEVVFGEGTPTTADNTIFNHLNGLIGNAQPGSAIIVALHSVSTDNSVRSALIAAQNKGVEVWVVYDQTDGRMNWVNSSRFRVCNYACLKAYNDADDAHDSIMHSKFVLFSNTRFPDGRYGMASWVGSANLTAQTGSGSMNNAITYYGDSDVWWNLWAVWMDMYQAPPNEYGPNFNYFTWPADNPSTYGNGVFYAANAATFGIFTPATNYDVWTEQLKQVTPSAGCQVAVMQAFITGTPGLNAANQLARLARGGCTVYVVGNRQDDGDTAVSADARNAMCNASANGHNMYVYATRRVHNKFVAVNGTINGTPNTSVVWTGSHNITGDALFRNAETMVRVQGPRAMADQFINETILGMYTSVQTLCYPAGGGGD